jgi:hypothetical protein
MMDMNQPRWQRLLVAAALVTSGAIAGANMSLNVAHGEVSATPEPPTFKAGDVPILKDISATLRQMDARLARLEITAQKIQATAAARSVTKTDAKVNVKAN